MSASTVVPTTTCKRVSVRVDVTDVRLGVDVTQVHAV